MSDKYDIYYVVDVFHSDDLFLLICIRLLDFPLFVWAPNGSSTKRWDWDRNVGIEIETFKKNLDDFLELILDVTRLEGATSYTFNNLDNWIAAWMWSLRNGA